MTTKHAPGPWRIAAKNKDNCMYYIHALDYSSGCGREFQIVVIDHGPHPIKEHRDMVEANARLIAAAPELLEALIEWLEVNGIDPFMKDTTGHSKLTAKSIKAIEKALNA